MQETILVSDDEVSSELAFVDQQRRALHICREIENDICCVRLAGAQRSIQRRAARWRRLKRGQFRVHRRVLVAAFIDER